MPRMNVLSPSEQEQFDTPPVFTSAQRKYFFDFPLGIRELAADLRSAVGTVGFLVGYGYFKSSKRFFLPQHYHQRDLDYVARQLGLSENLSLASLYHPRTRRHHQHIILEYCGYKPFDHAAAGFFTQEIQSMVRLHLKPKLIFWRCVDILTREKIQIPRYYGIARLIIAALNGRKEELSETIRATLTTETKALLDDLFVQESGSEDLSTNTPYKLTRLKKLSQSSKPLKVRERVGDLVLLEDLYDRLQPVLAILKIDHGAIRYFAGSVIRSEIFQLTRRTDDDRYLYVIAFIAHQFYCLQDNLVDVLLASVQTFQHTAQREHKEQYFTTRKEHNHAVQCLLEHLESGMFQVLEDIQSIMDDAELEPLMKVTHIESLLDNNRENIQTTKHGYTDLRVKIQQGSSQSQYYDILESRSLKLQNRVSAIIKTLRFQGESYADELMQAIEYYKQKDGSIGKQAPTGFLSPDEAAAVDVDGKSFRTSLYKVFLFLHIATAIKSGTLNLLHSYKYQSLDTYMISKSRWETDKLTLLDRSNMQEFSDPMTVLKTLDGVLHQQYQQTNDHLAHGENVFLKTKGKQPYQVTTPKQEDQETYPLRPFFPDQNFVPLSEILSTVNQHTGFLSAFQHWQQVYTKQSVDEKTLYAAIMGLGCSIGTHKMARISSNIKETALQQAVNWYVSLENVQAANDRVVKLMDQMELPNLYRRTQEALHTASDGQKFEVRQESLNANYSFKYFGKGQGVSAYTFIDERHLLWHSLVFSASERESAYVVDGLMRNDVIKSDIHSTDTHGYSEAIFATTHMLGFSYAPRIKNLKEQHLYIFKSHHQQQELDWQIRPDKYVSVDLIRENWDDILRLVTTIKLKGNQCLGHVPPAQFVFETKPALQSVESVWTDYQIPLHPALS